MLTVNKKQTNCSTWSHSGHIILVIKQVNLKRMLSDFNLAEWWPLALCALVHIVIRVSISVKNSRCAQFVCGVKTDPRGIPETHCSILMPTHRNRSSDFNIFNTMHASQAGQFLILDTLHYYVNLFPNYLEFFGLPKCNSCFYFFKTSVLIFGLPV